MILYLISPLSVFIPLTLAFIQWRKIPDNISLIRWLLVSSLLADIMQIVLAGLRINNWLVGDVFMYMQFVLLLYILGKQFIQTKFVKASQVALVTLYGICLLLLEKHETLNAFAGLVLIIISILFFYKLLSELKVVKIHRQPIVWIAFGTLAYYSGNLFVFLAKSYLLNSGNLGSMWMVHNTLNIMKNILFAIALWQNYRTMKSSA